MKPTDHSKLSNYVQLLCAEPKPAEMFSAGFGSAEQTSEQKYPTVIASGKFC